MTKLLAVFCAAMGIAAFGETEVDNLWIGSPAELSEAEGNTTILNQLEIYPDGSGIYSINKTGLGSYYVNNISFFDVSGNAFSKSATIDLTISGGHFGLKSTAREFPDDSLLVTEPVYHFDASDEQYFSISNNETTGKKDVYEWYDVRVNDRGEVDVKKAYRDLNTYVNNKEIPTLAENALNNMSVVDFGSFNGWNPEGDPGSWLRFNDFNVQSCVMVVRGDSAFWLGNLGSFPFHRGGYGVLLDGGNSSVNARSGSWYVDGVRINPVAFSDTASFHVFSFVLPAGETVNTFCRDRWCRVGGAQIAEAYLFNSAIGDDERKELEARLLDKWFNAKHPFVNGLEPQQIRTLTFGGGVERVVDTDADMTINSIAGEGEFIKEGAGKVTIGKNSKLTDINVKAGAVSSANYFNALMSEARVWIDPSNTNTWTLDGNDGLIRIDDVRGNGRYATAYNERMYYGTKWDAVPTITVDSESGLSLIDLGPNTYTEGGEGAKAMRFDAEYVNMRTIFVVAQRTGSDTFLLGSSDICFHHGNGGANILGSGEGRAANALYAAKWNISGSDVESIRAEPFPNTLELYTISDADFTDQWASDGALIQYLGCDRGYLRYGGIKYGEIIAFEKQLPPEDVEIIKNYLLAKWKGNTEVTVESVAKMDSVSVAAGAKFDFKGDLEVSDTLSVGFPVDEDSPSIAIDGALTLSADATIALTADYGVVPAEGEYTLVRADMINGDVGSIAATGALADKFGCRFFVDDGELKVRLSKNGTLVIIR